MNTSPQHLADPTPSSGTTATVAIRRLAVLTLIYLATRAPAFLGFAAAQRVAGHPLSALAAQERWDGWWYLYLAEYGYPDGLTIEGRDGYGPWGFFPAWPMLIRLVARLGVDDYRLSGLFISTACGLALTLALYRLASNWTGRRAALWTVTLFLASPGAVVLALPYTEALFLLFAVAALDTMVRGQWWLASAATLGACCVRSTGVAVVAAGLVAYALHVREWYRRPVGERTARPALAGLSIPVAGAAGIAMSFGYAWYRTGDPLIWFSAQRQWNQRLDFGTELAARFGKAALGTEPDRVHYLVMLVSLIMWLGLLAWAARSYRLIPLPALAYTGVTVALALLYSSVGPRPRMLQAALPVFVALGASAVATRPAVLRWFALGLMLCLSAIYAYLIMDVPSHVTA